MANEFPSAAPVDLTRPVSNDSQPEQNTDKSLTQQTIPVPAGVPSKRILEAPPESQRSKHETGVRRRQDKGCLHAVRSSHLSRPLLNALKRHGENLRALRKMECDLRAALKPKGALGELLFDRFWESLLRLILIARMEGDGLSQKGGVSQASDSSPFLQEGPLPILVEPAQNQNLADDQVKQALDPDVFRRFALIARYDRAASRELYRTLSLLVMMRRDGEAALESWVRTIAGTRGENSPADKSA